MMGRRELIGSAAALALLGGRAEAQAIKVSHKVTPIQQPSKWSCWAAAATMIYNWKAGFDQGIEAVVGLAGPKYVQIYKDSFPPANQGIDAKEEAAFYAALPMQVIQGLNPTVAGWGNILTSKGPLSITVDAVPGTRTYHALVVTGMDGDGTAANTIVTYIDPADGLSHSVLFDRFTDLYEGSASWPLQIIHNP